MYCIIIEIEIKLILSIFRRRKFFYLEYFNLHCEAFKFDITLYEATHSTNQSLLHTNMNYLVF